MSWLFSQQGAALLDQDGNALLDFDDRGTIANMARRLRAVLPDRWFADDAPGLDTLLSALGAQWAAIFDQVQFASLQARLLTVEGGLLDIAATDYRGGAAVRRPAETDAAFRSRLLPIFRERVTRSAVIGRLVSIGCTSVQVFEPRLASDTGGYGIASSLGYGAAGGYGSLALPWQCFISTHRPIGERVGNIGGYGASAWGYGAGRAEYAPRDESQPVVTDADIYAAIAETMPAGTVGWTRIT